MEKITAIRVKYPNNTFSDEIPIGVLVQNIDWDNTKNLKQILGNVDIDNKGNIQQQIDDLVSLIVVDSALSPTSTNPVQNKIIKQALDTKADKINIPKNISDLTNDLNFITRQQAPVTSVNGLFGDVRIDLSKLNEIDELEERINTLEDTVNQSDNNNNNNNITIDSQLSNTSQHPVQNKVIKQALDNIENQFTSVNEAIDGYNSALSNHVEVYDARITSIENAIRSIPSGGGGSDSSGGTPIIIDSILLDDSSNPVQNKIIKQALDTKANIEDIPMKVSDLENDLNFLTQIPVPSISIDEQTNTIVIQDVNNNNSLFSDIVGKGLVGYMLLKR